LAIIEAFSSCIY